MAESVDLELLTTTDEGRAGDRVTVDVSRAKMLVRGGGARPATVPDAKDLGVPKSTAATAPKPDKS